MKRFVVIAAMLVSIGCKPTPPQNVDSDTPAVENGNSAGDQKNTSNGGDKEITPAELPDNPTRDLSEEQEQVDKMEITALVEALGDEKLGIVAVDELKTRGTDAVEPLTSALDSENETVKQRAILALGMLGAEAKSALPKLKAIAENDDHSEVLTATAANAVDAIEGN